MENVGLDGQRGSVKHLDRKRPKMTENDRKTSSLRLYCVFTGCLLIPYPVRHLELSKDKGTKRARETSDMVGWGGTTNDTNDTNNS